MPFPAVTDFTYETRFQRWVAQVAGVDFDVVVADAGGKPDPAALQLLETAFGGYETLVETAHASLRAFSSDPAVGADEKPGVIELSASPRRGVMNVFVTLNFDKDAYGLWSVGFVPMGEKRWFPTSVMREAW